MSPFSLTNLFNQFRAAFRSDKKNRSLARFSAAKLNQDLPSALEQRSLLASTPLVFDIRTGIPLSSNPDNLTNVNGTIYFAADDGVYGNELWRVIPNSNVAERVADINSGAIGSNPNQLFNFNGTLYFVANDGFIGNELWRVNNTSGNAELVTDINITPNNSSYINSFTNVNGTLYFSARDANSGLDLWRVNNTTGMAEAVSDFDAGIDSSFPNNLTNVNGTLYFTADTIRFGEELWRVNNTTGIAELVVDVNIGFNDSNPDNLINVNGTLYFTAENAALGNELWRVDSVRGIAELVRDINFGFFDSNIANLTNVDGTLFFTANDGNIGTELWRIPNTTGMAQAVSDINSNGSSNPLNLLNVNGTLYFTADDGFSYFGRELYRVNSTGFPSLVTDIFPGTGSSNIANLTNSNGTLFFSATDLLNGTELWRVNNPSSMATLVSVNPGFNSSTPSNLTEINGSLYFSAFSTGNGRELWTINNTTNMAEMINVNPGNPNSSPINFTNINGTVFFTATNATNGTELFKLVDLPEIEVILGNTNIPDNTGSVNLGTTFQGTGISRTFIIRNTGPGELNVGNITVPAGFSIIQQPSSPILPGSSATFIVQLNGAAVGSPSGTLSFVTNDSDETTFDFTINGTVIAPPIVQVFDNGVPVVNNIGDITFGATFLGEPVTKTFTIINTGASDLTVGLINIPSVPPGFTVTMQTPTTVPANGGMATFQITLDASAIGSFNGILSFTTSDMVDPTFSFFINGVVLGAEIAVSDNMTPVPNTTGDVTLGATFVGTPVTKTFTITNNGNNDLVLSQITVPAGFTVTQQPPVNILGNGGTGTFQITLDATKSGSYSGQLSFTTNDADDSTFIFSINGVVLGPEIAVSDNMTAVPNGTGDVTLGATFVGTPVTKTFTITNNGNNDLVLSQITVPAGFTVTQQPPASILGNGGTGTFQITLDATKSGSYSGQLSFTTNDADDPTFIFSINGVVLGPEIALFDGVIPVSNNTGDVTLGATFVGTPVTKTFTITNNGNNDLVLGQITVPAGFTVTQQPPASILGNGGTGTFQITLDANTLGSYFGKLSFTTNDADDPTFSFFINGVVLGPDIDVFDDVDEILNGVTSIDFGQTFAGVPVERTFTITNSGNNDLAPGMISVPTGFTVVTPPPQNIAAGASADFIISFTPDVLGEFSGEISFTTNDDDEPIFSFNVSGLSLDPIVTVREAGVILLDDSGTSSFGGRSVGNPLTKTFSVTNTGNTDLTPGSIVVPAGFSVIQELPGFIGINQTALFRIRFDALIPGIYNGQVSFTTNQFLNPDYTFNVNGTVFVN